MTSRQQLSGPQIGFIIVDKVGLIGGDLFDIPVVAPFPCNTFFVASIRGGDEGNTLIMYFNKLGYPQGTDFTTLKGSEQIFYFFSTLTLGPFYRSVLRFSQPVTNFFVALGTENGNASRYCIACTNDDEMTLRGGIYT